MTGMEPRRRWWALYVLCAGVLMIVLDTTIVNVALPSIREDLRFTETSLVWVVNAYMLTFGGFLLLGGRLGDLFGHRRLFLLGVTLFTLASLACGAASSQGMLIVARAAQGVAGAVVSAAFKRRQLASGAPVRPLHSFGVPAPLGARGFGLRFSCWQVAKAVPVMPSQSCVAPRAGSCAICAKLDVAAHNASATSVHLEAQISIVFSGGIMLCN